MFRFHLSSLGLLHGYLRGWHGPKRTYDEVRMAIARSVVFMKKNTAWGRFQDLQDFSHTDTNVVRSEELGGCEGWVFSGPLCVDLQNPQRRGELWNRHPTFRTLNTFRPHRPEACVQILDGFDGSREHHRRSSLDQVDQIRGSSVDQGGPRRSRGFSWG